MYVHIAPILANEIYQDYGSRYLGEYEEFCQLIQDEYEDLFNLHSDILLHRMDADDLEEISDQAYMEYMQTCP